MTRVYRESIVVDETTGETVVVESTDHEELERAIAEILEDGHG